MAKYYVSKKDRSVFEKFIDEATVNLSQHDYDSFIEDNVEHYRKAGIESLIIRRQLADCCDWCAALAGTYEYKRGKYPSDIFRRHENCRCMVTCSQEKGGYQDVWTKVEYKTQREARAAREEEIEKQQKNFEKFERKKRIARDNGEKFVDATEYLENKQKEYPERVKDTEGTFVVDGKALPVNGPNNEVEFSPSEDERKIAEWYIKKFGGEIQLMPKINKPEKHKMADYLLNGKTFIDLKSPIGDGKNVIANQLKNQKGQATEFIIDISNSGLRDNTDEIFRQAEEVFNGTHKKWVEEIMIIRDGELLKSYFRI